MTIAPVIDDVFAMAEHIERNGALFYRQVANRETTDEDVRRLLLELAEMEDDHEKMFAAMRHELSARERPVFEQEADAISYLHAVTDTLVIGGGAYDSSRRADIGSLAGVLRTAIELEKDSIAFYLGLKEMLVDESDKGQVDDIIREEMRHVIDLSRNLETE